MILTFWKNAKYGESCMYLPSPSLQKESPNTKNTQKLADVIAVNEYKIFRTDWCFECKLLYTVEDNESWNSQYRSHVLILMKKSSEWSLPLPCLLGFV